MGGPDDLQPRSVGPDDALTARKEAEAAERGREAWLRGQREALETALDGSPLETSLGALVHAATEALGPGTRAAFYLTDGAGRALYHVVGMSAAYAEAVNGFEIGAGSLACGLATHTGQPVLTTDVTTDPRWEPWRWMAERFDYRGCWSFPIRTSAGKFVGSLAIYSRRPREATTRDTELAALLTQTAAILIARHREAGERRQAEEALRDSERRFRALVRNSSDVILLFDPSGTIVYQSASMERLLGYRPEERAGHNVFRDPIVHPEDLATKRAFFEAILAQPGSMARAEFRLRHADGTWREIEAVGQSFVQDPAVAGIVANYRDVTERKHMEDALREARDRLEERVSERTAELARANAALLEGLAARKELLRKLATAQEDERRRVARDLHDGLGQELTALILSFKALERAIPEDAPGRARLLEVERIVDVIGREAHDLAVELRPTALDDLGLGPALSAYLARWSERTGVAAAFQPVGLDGDRLPPEVETAVYRIMQEALNNVAKHAGAGRVGVVVSRHRGELTALIEDDGRGFDPERAGEGSGRRSLGLLGMQERVDLVGGTLVIESAEGEGTVIQARIPLRPAQGDAGLRRG